MFKTLGLTLIGISMGTSVGFAGEFNVEMPALESLRQSARALRTMPQAPTTMGLSIAYRYTDDGGPDGGRKKVDYQLIVESGRISKLRLGGKTKSAVLSAAQMAELTRLAAAVVAAKPESMIQRNANTLRGVSATLAVNDGARSLNIGLNSNDDVHGALGDLFVGMEHNERANLGGLGLLWNPFHHRPKPVPLPLPHPSTGTHVNPGPPPYPYPRRDDDDDDENNGCRRHYDDECTPPNNEPWEPSNYQPPAEEPSNDQPAEEPSNDQPTEEPSNDQPAEEPSNDESPAEAPAESEPPAEAPSETGDSVMMHKTRLGKELQIYNPNERRRHRARPRSP